MKYLAALAVVMAITLFNFSPSALSQADPLPASGTYFIVSADTKEALQPEANTAGQNVFLHEFNQSGMQKWIVKRFIDPKTKKPLNKYTIRLTGENADLYLQPFPAQDHTCMISSGSSNFTLAKAGDSFQLKSSAQNGDALYAFPSPPGNTEARFGPADSAAKFNWDFIAAN